MTERRSQFQGLFPRRLPTRLALGTVSIIVIAFCGAALWAFVFIVPRPRSLVEFLLTLAVEELFLALLLFFLTMLVWVIAMPEWLVRSFDAVIWKLLWANLLAFIPLLILELFR